MITTQDIGRAFITKDGLEMTIRNHHPDSESYFIAVAPHSVFSRIYHESGSLCDSIYAIPAIPRVGDFDRWAHEKPYSDKPECIQDILNEWETNRTYDPAKVMEAKKVLHEKGVVIADQIRGKRKPLIVFTFNNTIKLEAVDSYLKSVREQIGHSYDIIAVNGAEMSIVDTEELKVTKVL